MLAAVAENFSYRQILAAWQVSGAAAAWRGRQPPPACGHARGLLAKQFAGERPIAVERSVDVPVAARPNG